MIVFNMGSIALISDRSISSFPLVFPIAEPDPFALPTRWFIVMFVFLGVYFLIA